MMSIGFSPGYMQIQSKEYLALGDSYTIGESVDYLERFPVQLVNRLKFSGINMEQPKIVAKTGWTTDELLSALNAEPLPHDFDLVTLLIGVNNQYRGRAIENYREEFEVLLERAIDYAGGDSTRVIVISIPDYGVTPFGKKRGRKQIAKEIDSFNQVNREIAAHFGVAYVNVAEISRDALRQTILVADDELHPSGEMYKRWVEELLPLATNILTGQHE